MKTRFVVFILLVISMANCVPTLALSTSKVSTPTSTPTHITIPATFTAFTTLTHTRTPDPRQVSCPRILADIPKNDINGKVILNGAYFVFDIKRLNYVNPGPTFLWDIKNDIKTDLTFRKGAELYGFLVSPDHRFFVYEERKDRDRIIIRNSAGLLIRTVYDIHYFLPESWLDNQHIAIWSLDQKFYGIPFPTYIYDPFAQDSRLIQPDYPNITIWDSYLWPETETIYSPDQKYVVYATMPDETGAGDIVLWDIEKQKQIVSINHAYMELNNINPPLWSPDGQEFIIDARVDENENIELYSINLGGELKKLTNFNLHLNEQQKKEFEIWNYSWSGDGQYIAFWYRLEKNEPAHLAILEIQNRKLRGLCVSSRSHFDPIWSIDNNQLLVEGYFNDEDVPYEKYKVNIIDIKDNYVVEIARDVIPAGWLVSEP